MLTPEHLQQLRHCNSTEANVDPSTTINLLLDEIERLHKERERLEILANNMLLALEKVETLSQAQAHKIQELESFIKHIKAFIHSNL